MSHVLVVEDEASFSEAIAYMLRKEGFDVSVVADGLSAITEFDRHGADLVLLDLMLPGMSGIEVCAAFRRLPPPQPVILMLTARASEDDAVAGFEAGADDYVRKPFGVAELGRRIDALLSLATRARQQDGPRAIRVGRLAIDLLARSVLVGEEAVRLTPKEFDLLAHFAQRSGLLLEREAILLEVWGYKHSGYARTVDSHVTRIRKKLTAAGLDLDLIATVHGVGYRFGAP